MSFSKLPEEAIHSIYSYLDKPSYSSLSTTSKFNKKVGTKSSSLFTYPNKSNTAFYKGYALSVYQKDMLDHLMEYGKQSFYKIVPDQENLFLITVLYVDNMSEFTDIIVIGEKDMSESIRHIPLVYKLYLENKHKFFIGDYFKISHKEVVQKALEKNKDTLVIDIGLRSYDTKSIHRDISLLLGNPSYYHNEIHPSYVHEQVNEVWVTSLLDIPYKFEENPIQLSHNTVMTPSVVNQANFFTVDAMMGGVYHIYAALTRYGKGRKMLRITSSYPRDYGSNVSTSGHVVLPFKFYLEMSRLPSKPAFNGSRSFESVSNAYTFAELTLLTSIVKETETSNIGEELLDDIDKLCPGYERSLVATEHTYSGRKSLRISKFEEIEKGPKKYVWILTDPQAELCDPVHIQDVVGKASENTIKLREAKRLEEEKASKLISMKYNLRSSMNVARSREGYTVKELKEIASSKGISIKGLTKKADIAKAILDKL